MSIFCSRLGLALVLAALGLGGRSAHAQAAPVPYRIPGWVGFGGNPAVGQSLNTYGNFASFDGNDAPTRYNFANGLFVGGEGGDLGLSTNGVNRDTAFGSLYYQGVQFGYHFSVAGGLPLTVYAGFDTVNYSTVIGGPDCPLRHPVRHTARLWHACGRRIQADAGCQPVTRVRLHPTIGHSDKHRASKAEVRFSAARGAHAKAAEVPLDGCCRCVVVAWRFAASSDIERSRACLPLDAHYRRCVANVSGAKRTRWLITCHRRRCRSSQRRCPIAP